MSAQTLAEFLSGLPEEERIILTLYYVRSLTAEEIATALGVPERSVAAVIVTGRARLTARLNL
jgi:RNA polymerase sigma factor for flagellar operon FliA